MNYQVNDLVQYRSAVSDEIFTGRIMKINYFMGVPFSYQIARSDGIKETIPAINVIRKLGN